MKALLITSFMISDVEFLIYFVPLAGYTPTFIDSYHVISATSNHRGITKQTIDIVLRCLR